MISFKFSNAFAVPPFTGTYFNSFSPIIKEIFKLQNAL